MGKAPLSVLHGFLMWQALCSPEEPSQVLGATSTKLTFIQNQGRQSGVSVITNHNSLLTNLTVHTHYSGASQGYLDNL